jgi:hypothetical protein
MFISVLALGAGGCTLDFFSGGDDGGGDDVQCDPSDTEPGPTHDLRNPETLECQSFTEYDCPPSCDCAYPPSPTFDEVAIPSWGACESACRTLGELDCMNAVECRTVYDYACYTGDGPCYAEQAYVGCYPIDQDGPIDAGECLGLDAYACSYHNDCAALHSPLCNESGTFCWSQFVQCVSEDRAVPFGG